MEKEAAKIRREQYKLMLNEKYSPLQKKIAYKRASKDGDRCFGCAALYGAKVYKKTTTYFKKYPGGRKMVCKECKRSKIVHDLTQEEEEEVRKKWASISDDPFYELEFTVVEGIGMKKTPENTESRPGETHGKERDGELGDGAAETRNGELEAGTAETQENEQQMVIEKRDIEEAELLEELAEIEPYSQNTDSGTDWEKLESIKEELAETETYSQNTDSGTDWEKLEGIKEMIATTVREYEEREAERKGLCIMCNEVLKNPNTFGDFFTSLTSSSIEKFFKEE